MSIEVYKQEQEKIKAEEEKKRRQEAGEPEEDREPLTTEEIIADKEKSDLLGKMLERDGGPESKEVMIRLKSGTLTEADIDNLSKYRDAFDKKMQKVENVSEEITPEMVAELGEHDPKLKKLLEHVSPDKLVDVVQDRLGELAMSEPDQFKIISKKIEKMQDFKKGDFKKLDDSVREMCRERNINTDEAMKALAIKDDMEREKALTQIIRDSWGAGAWGNTKRFLDSVGFKAWSANRTLVFEHKKYEIDNVFAELDKHKKNIGKALAVTVKGNDDMRNALANAILGKSTKKEQRGFKDAESTPQMRERDMEAAWLRRKNSNFPTSTPGVSRRWDALSVVEKDQARQTFIDEIATQEKAKRKGGFWDSIFQALFESFLLNKKASLN